MKKTFILIIFLAAFVFQNGYAQQDTLLYRYRRTSVGYQQQVKIAKHSLEGAESKFKAAKSGYGPKLDFSSNYSFYGVPLQLAPPADAPPGTIGDDLHNFYSLDLTLSQPIITGGYLKNTKKAAESEVEAMKNYVKLSEQQVMLMSDKTYLKVVAKREINRLAMAYREIVGQFVKTIQNRLDEGMVGKDQLYQANVRYNDAQYHVIKSKKEYEMSLMDLNKMLGYPIDTVPWIADSLAVLNWVFSGDSLVEKALTNRPDIKYLKNEVLANQYREKLTISKYKPQLGVLAGGKWGSPSPGLQIDPDFNYYFKAKLAIPIFYWGQKKNEAFAVKQVTEITKLKVEQTKDDVSLQVQRSYFNLVKSQEQMVFAEGALDNAKNNVSVMLDRYNEGLSSVLEVLNAQAFWQLSYYNFIQAKYEVNVAYSDYLYSLGELKTN
jgi:outer membrane protein TolC